MSENPSDDLLHTLRERGAHYVVDTHGQPVAVLLTLEEYQHYLALLDDEADSQDAELAARLEQAAAQSGRDTLKTSSINWPARRAQLRERATALGLYEPDRRDDAYWEIVTPLLDELDHELYA